MSVVSKALVVVGGTVITTGLILWWLKEHPVVPPAPTCEDITTESECINAGCYWYNDKCHSTPESPPGTHYDCIKDPMTGLIMCGLVEGIDENKCDPYAPPDYCWGKVPCTSDSDCGYGAKCIENKCYWTANELLDWEGTTQVAQTRFDFEKRVVGNKLMGDIGFKLDAWSVACDPNVMIFLIRDGKRKCVYAEKHIGLPGTWGEPAYRTDPFSVFMDAEAVDGIEFWCKCTRGFPWWYSSDVLIKVHAQFLYI